jgi:hypothetical protein
VGGGDSGCRGQCLGMIGVAGGGWQWLAAAGEDGGGGGGGSRGG